MTEEPVAVGLMPTMASPMVCPPTTVVPGRRPREGTPSVHLARWVTARPTFRNIRSRNSWSRSPRPRRSWSRRGMRRCRSELVSPRCLTVYGRSSGSAICVPVNDHHPRARKFIRRGPIVSVGALGQTLRRQPRFGALPHPPSGYLPRSRQKPDGRSVSRTTPRDPSSRPPNR